MKPKDPTLVYAELPPGWERDNQGRYFNAKKGILVLATVELHGGKVWAHVSISRKGIVPRWDDLVFLKKHWLGEDCYAVSVLPPREFHVNIHPRCLHLYAPMDGVTGLPEFSVDIPGFGRSI